MSVAKTKDQTSFQEAFARLPYNVRLEAKQKYAFELITAEPLRGVSKINDALIEKFGVGGSLPKDWLSAEVKKERVKRGHPALMRPYTRSKGAPVTALTAVTALPMVPMTAPAPARLDLPGAVASIVAALTPFDEKHRRRIIEAITILMFERPEA